MSDDVKESQVDEVVDTLDESGETEAGTANEAAAAEAVDQA